MKAVTLLLLFAAFPSRKAEGDQTLSLRCLKEEILTYQLTMKQKLWSEEQTEQFLLTAKVDIHCIADGFLSRFNQQGMKFFMRVYNFGVKVINGEVEEETTPLPEEDLDELGTEKPETIQSAVDKDFSKPFYFVQLENGTVAHVLHADESDLQVLNIKRAIASLFQVSTLDESEGDVEETGSANKHTAHYRIEKGSKGETRVHKEYSSSNVKQFPPGSNVEPAEVDYDEDEDIVYEGGVPKMITGKMHAALFKKSEAENDDEETSDDGSYQSNSALDNEFTSDQEYKLMLVQRREKPQKRSVTMVRIEDTHGLRISSVETKHDEANAVKTRLESLKSRIPLLIDLLDKIAEVRGDHNDSYNDLIYMLELEGLCEYRRCSGEVETPVSDAVIDHFETDSPSLRRFLFPLLVASNTKASQEQISYVLKDPKKYNLDLNFVLTDIAFVHRPSQKIVSLVTAYATDGAEEIRDEALLALGALAQSADASTSSKIVALLLNQLGKLSTTSDQSFAQATTLLFAIGNTRDSAAIEPLSDLLVDETAFVKTRLASALVLNQFDESRVDEVLLERLRRQRNKTAYDGIVHLLADRARKDGNPTELEKTVATYQLINEDLAETDGDFNNATRLRTRRGIVATSSSTDWAASNGQFNDINSRSHRLNDKSRYQNHVAYLYGTRLGVNKLHLRLTAGAFAGENRQNPNIVKIFGKAVAYAHAFGRDFRLLESHVIVTGTDSTISYEIYARVGSRTIIPRTTGTFPACKSQRKQVGSGSNYRALSISINLPLIFGLTVNFHLSGYVRLGGDAGFKVCPTQQTIGSAYFRPTVTFGASGGASVGLVVVRGGIQVSASITYWLKPEATLSRQGIQKLQACLNIYFGRDPVSVTIGAFYQHRTLRWKKWGWVRYPVFTWSSRKSIGFLTKTFKVGSTSSTKLYGRCAYVYIG